MGRVEGNLLSINSLFALLVQFSRFIDALSKAVHTLELCVFLHNKILKNYSTMFP